MYTMTFNKSTLKDLWAHHPDNPSQSVHAGRQFYGAVVIPDSGVFTNKTFGSSTDVPYILCPYQVNDIIAIQEKWAMSTDGYVYGTDYADDSETGNYAFRPAYTMPTPAVRMYGRITSVAPFTVTPEIYKNYLPKGVTTQGCAGTAKVVDNYSSGGKLLSPIRGRRNREILSQVTQPYVSGEPPLAVSHALYYMDGTYAPTFRGYLNMYNPDNKYEMWMSQTDFQITVSSSKYAQTYDNGKDGNNNWILKRGSLIDKNYGGWYRTALSMYQFNLMSSDDQKHLLPIGVASWTPSVYDNPIWIYLWLRGNNRHDIPMYNYRGEEYNLVVYGNPIPINAYYELTSLDPSMRLSCWLISGYLCDKDGNVYGNWMN